jgi:hypothetical protein
MAMADHGGPAVDLYQLLGVRREASREEIAQAWRHRARAEQPDRRPGEGRRRGGGPVPRPGRAWRVLGDPARRAAYDQAPAREQPSVTPVPARRPSRLGGRDGTTPPVRVAGPPLRAGPVRIEDGPRPVRQAGSGDEEDVRLALLAELLLRYLARDGAAVVNPRWADLDRGLFSISVAAELAGCSRRLCGSTSGRGWRNPRAARAAPAGTPAGTSTGWPRSAR